MAMLRSPLAITLSVVCVFVWVIRTGDAWVPPPLPANALGFQVSPQTSTLQSKIMGDLLGYHSSTRHRRFQSTIIFGFGGFGSPGDGGQKKKKETKLKPKQQWDRFIGLKKEKKIRVAVRMSDEDEWLEVGNIKSKDDKYTEFALTRQRALIAEHARRLFPLQISPRDTVTWAFWNEDTDQWTVVDKSILDDVKSYSAGLEKSIGFEGRPDPSSGFYCVYNEGRLVNDGDDARPSSKRLK